VNRGIKTAPQFMYVLVFRANYKEIKTGVLSASSRRTKEEVGDRESLREEGEMQ